jgi:hypothetical protein
MNNLGDYPLGAANDPKAPWNEKENPEVEIDVTVSITLSKTVTVKVRDYDIIDEGVNDDGFYYCDRDFSDTNLLAAVEEQVVLPQDASLYVDVGSNLKAANDLSGWHVDEIECIKE